ncbi:MAG: helix-turn-helix transcriptional regulator [Oscillospiraceae bacterium]|nr:helix-turn-helix transcriptional regulator [Oscillospiraceae bacterium]
MGNLYERILSLCQEADIRPGRLCADLGLSRSLITDLKMGRKKSINAETAQKIAGYFFISVGQLLGQDADDRSPVSSQDILDQVDMAFYGDFKELDEEEKETVRDMVRLMRQRRAAKQRT